MSTARPETPGTSPDPEERDSNQLPPEDTLDDRGVDGILDEGTSPPDRPPNRHRLETEREQYEGESLAERLAQELPDVGAQDAADRPTPGDREADRTGRLVEADDDASHYHGSSTAATDVGIAGGAASAEEAAMHLVDEDELGATDRPPETER